MEIKMWGKKSWVRYHTRHPLRTLLPLQHMISDMTGPQKSFLSSQLLSRNLTKTLQALICDILFLCGDRAKSDTRKSCKPGEGFVKFCCVEKACVGEGGECAG